VAGPKWRDPSDPYRKNENQRKKKGQGANGEARARENQDSRLATVEGVLFMVWYEVKYGFESTGQIIPSDCEIPLSFHHQLISFASTKSKIDLINVYL
jgi:hypothetical protein